MIDFSKPLAYTDKRTGLIQRNYEVTRVLCTDLIGPVGFKNVVVIRNRNAYFGDEEFLVKASDDGQCSAQGFDGALINYEEREGDSKLRELFVDCIARGQSIWLYGDGDLQLAHDAIEDANVRNYEMLSARWLMEYDTPANRARALQRLFEDMDDQDIKVLFIDNTGVDELPYQLDIFTDHLRVKGLQIIGAGRNNAGPAFNNRVTHLDLKQIREMQTA